MHFPQLVALLARDSPFRSLKLINGSNRIFPVEDPFWENDGWASFPLTMIEFLRISVRRALCCSTRHDLLQPFTM